VIVEFVPVAVVVWQEMAMMILYEPQKKKL